MNKVELTPELLRELQLKQLDMMVYFRRLCAVGRRRGRDAAA